MATLLLRLAGPMQAWGVQSQFGVRDSMREPTKSGVLGLVCAALGRPRESDISDLSALRFGVRADQEGVMQVDYQTVGKGGWLKANGDVDYKTVKPSQRFYLADARFLAGLQGDIDVLRQVHAALRDPHWPLFLGRKAFPPGEPVWLRDGLQPDLTLEQAFRQYGWLAEGIIDEPPEVLRVVLPDEGGPIVRNDQPISFADRVFAPRRMRVDYVRPVLTREEEASCTSPS